MLREVLCFVCYTTTFIEENIEFSHIQDEQSALIFIHSKNNTKFLPRRQEEKKCYQNKAHKVHKHCSTNFCMVAGEKWL